MTADPAADFLTRFPLLHTRDLDESRLVIGGLWGKHAVEVVGRIPFETLVNHVELGSMGLTYVRCPTPLQVHGTAGGERVTVYLHEEGRAEHRLDAEAAVAVPGSGVIVVPGQEARMQTGPVRLLALDFPCARVAPALAARGLPPLHCAQWASYRNLSSPAGEALRSLARWVATELDRPGTPLVGGPVAEHLEQTLFSLFLSCVAEPFAPSAPADLMLGKIRLCDLEGWVLANLEQPLSVDTLARIAGVSPRAVQLAFRRHRRCTPMAFIRRARLNAIRRALLSGGEPVTVTAIAMQFGFFHLGHFAEAYRREFGERPGDTLQRLRRPLPSGGDRTTD